MSVQEIHLGHLAGLDAARDVDVGLHRLVVGVTIHFITMLGGMPLEKASDVNDFPKGFYVAAFAGVIGKHFRNLFQVIAGDAV